MVLKEYIAAIEQAIYFSASIFPKQSGWACSCKASNAMLALEVYCLLVKNTRKMNMEWFLGNPIKSMSSFKMQSDNFSLWISVSERLNVSLLRSCNIYIFLLNITNFRFVSMMKESYTMATPISFKEYSLLKTLSTVMFCERLSCFVLYFSFGFVHILSLKKAPNLIQRWNQVSHVYFRRYLA